MPRTELRVAIVTGGARGIGAAIATRLHRDGLAVASLDLLTPDAARPGIVDLPCDLTDADAVTATFAAVRERLGPVAVVVHCAAFQHVAPFTELDPADWRRSFAVNVDGAFHVVRAALPDLRAADAARIVIITSSSYFTPPPGMSHYIATKGALTGLVRGLSVELGAERITVNAVAPGLTATANARHDISQEHFALVRSRQAIPRTGEPDDIAGAVSYLVSADADFVTGQTLVVDGGESRV